MSAVPSPTISMKKSLFVFADGGSRGNPGPAAIGFVVKDSKGKVLVKKGKFIGRATNNVAEYRAVIEALAWLKKNSLTTNCQLLITFFLDSKLIVNQLNGLYKIKNSGLRNLIVKVRQLEQEIGGSVSYHYIPREKNEEADSIAKIYCFSHHIL